MQVSVLKFLKFEIEIEIDLILINKFFVGIRHVAKVEPPNTKHLLIIEYFRIFLIP